MVIDNIQRVTETMLTTAQKDIERMQKAIDVEREANHKLVEEQLKRLQKYQPPPGIPFLTIPSGTKIDFQECDSFGRYCSAPRTK
jgi:hypothetical protein